MQETLIVVPCYNEAERLDGQRFFEYCAAEPALSFLFVDDGSTDRTFEVLSRLVARLPERMSVLQLAANAGKAEAVRQGVLRAFSSSAQLVGYWDADLATPLYNIAQFAQVLDRTALQLVLGSRVRLLGRHVERDAVRHYIGRGFATLAALALDLTVYDTQCGAKLFRAGPVFKQVFEQPFELGWSFDVELLARFTRIVRQSGLDPKTLVMEMPLEEWIDAPGSKLRPSHMPRIAWEMCKLFAIARRK